MRDTIEVFNTLRSVKSELFTTESDFDVLELATFKANLEVVLDTP